MDNMKNLIELVKARPVLYDVSLNKDNESRRLAWQEISFALQQPADDCMEKWKSLRAQFRYYYKGDHFNDWKYAQDMAFLEQHIRWQRKSLSFNHSINDDNVESIQQNGHHNKTVANSPVSPRLRAKFSNKSQSEPQDEQISTEKSISLVCHKSFALNQKINCIIQNIKPLIAIISIVFILMIVFYYQLF